MSNCTHAGCNRNILAKGLCSVHYERRRSGRDMDAPIVKRDAARGCSVAGCNGKHREGGYCAFHIQRLKHGTPLDAPRPVSRVANPICSVSACEAPTHAGGLCNPHYRRMTAGRSLDTPIRPVNLPAGSTKTDGGGYIIEKASDGRWIGQHRLRMEESLGRPLTADESAHHINGQRDDNRLENLELWSRYQPAGQRVADKIAYAKEILALYAPQFLAGSDV